MPISITRVRPVRLPLGRNPRQSATKSQAVSGVDCHWVNRSGSTGTRLMSSRLSQTIKQWGGPVDRPAGSGGHGVDRHRALLLAPRTHDAGRGACPAQEPLGFQTATPSGSQPANSHDWGVAQSMGSTGDCFDNSMAESFFATLECELLDRMTLSTHAEARKAVFDFIECWYNTQRRYSALGYRSPLEFELLDVGPVDAIQAITSPLDPTLRAGPTPPQATTPMSM